MNPKEFELWDNVNKHSKGFDFIAIGWHLSDTELYLAGPSEIEDRM